MAVYREFRMGSGNKSAGFLLPLLILLGFFLLIYFVAKGLYIVFSWLSPALLLGALIINYRVVTSFLQRLWYRLIHTPFKGLIYLVVAVIAYPFTAAYLFFSALFGQSAKTHSTFQSHTFRKGTHHEEPVVDVEYEEIDTGRLSPRP